ncbi:MAG: hypothetical protein R2848_11725 [Thermomicrobiales bacterium]
MSNRVNDNNVKWYTLIAACFALFMAMLDNLVVNIALPTISRIDLDAAATQLQWVISAIRWSSPRCRSPRGRSGRQVRPETLVHDRIGDLHRCFGNRGVLQQHEHAHHHARPAGDWARR